MTIIYKKVPLRTRMWRKIRYRGIRFAKYIQYCDDFNCGCCLKKVRQP